MSYMLDCLCWCPCQHHQQLWIASRVVVCSSEGCQWHRYEGQHPGHRQSIQTFCLFFSINLTGLILRHANHLRKTCKLLVALNVSVYPMEADHQLLIVWQVRAFIWHDGKSNSWVELVCNGTQNAQSCSGCMAWGTSLFPDPFNQVLIHGLSNAWSLNWRAGWSCSPHHHAHGRQYLVYRGTSHSQGSSEGLSGSLLCSAHVHWTAINQCHVQSWAGWSLPESILDGICSVCVYEIPLWHPSSW